MADNRTINTSGGNYNERIGGNYIQGNYYAAGQPKSLAEALIRLHPALRASTPTLQKTAV